MKNIKIFPLIAVLMIFFGCETETLRPVVDLENGVFISAEFTSPATGSMVLNFEEADNEFEKLEWSASDFGVPVPVEYTIVASADANFASTYEIGVTASKSIELTVGEMNSAALTLGIAPFEAGDVYFRIITEVKGTNEIANLISSSITRTVTPYVTEFASIYMIGDAVKGWDTNLAVEVYGTGPNEYSAIAEFNNGGAFRFFSAADWNAENQYNWTFFEGGTVDAAFENANDGDTNIRFIGTTGFYRITVNIKDLTITMEAVSQPELYIVGAGAVAAGWSWDTPVQFDWIQDGIWETTTEFTNDAFRFFSVRDDWNSGKNYPAYAAEEYDIDDKLEDAMDGDNNFKFVGTPGIYKLVINEIEKTIVMADAGTAGPPYYLVGDGTQAGWDWVSPVEAIQFDAGVYTAEVTLNPGGAFRFFTVNGDWGSGRNHPYYVNDGYTIDPLFIDAADGDNNFKFTGEPGDYKLILDENNKTITLQGGAGDPLWGVGAGLAAAGWDWTTPVEFMQIGDGKYVGHNVEMINDAFRFFTVKDDWNSGLNYPYYDGEGFTIDSKLENANDGDSNFKCNTPGTYRVIIDNIAKTITLN